MSSGQQPTPRSALKHYRIRVIVAGSRDFDDYALFSQGMKDYLARHFEGLESRIIFITGAAASGADAMIIRWCQEHGYPWHEMPALWDDLEAFGAAIRYRRDGRAYNVRAGYDRNAEMAKVGTNLIVFWDGVSGGTQDMRKQALARRLPVETILISTPARKDPYVREESPGRRGRYPEVDRQAAARQSEHSDL